MTEILTARLRLRRFTHADLDVYFRTIYNDPDVMRTLPGGVPRSLEAVKTMLDWHAAHWERHGIGFFAVEARADGAFVGQAGVFIRDLPEFELGYAYGTTSWGKGYATEAGHACLTATFASGAHELICAVTDETNLGSKHVLTKLGFTRTGETPWRDEVLPYFTLKRADYAPPMRTV